MHIEMRSKSEGIREAGRSGVISAATGIERGLRDDGERCGRAQWRGERRDPPSSEPQHLGTLARVRVVWLWAMRFPLENGESNSLVKIKDKAGGEKIRNGNRKVGKKRSSSRERMGERGERITSGTQTSNNLESNGKY